MSTMIESLKRSKIPFLVLAVFLCVPLFASSVGASDNLVPTDLRQWESIEPLGETTITYVPDLQANHIIFTPENNLYFVGLVQGVDYIAGHTYNLSFGSTYNYVSHLTWGFGYRTSEDTFQYLSSSDSIQSENKMSFVAPDSVNSVYVIFEFDGTTSQTIQINHLLCVDITASEQQAVIDNANENTSRIGGWFADLWENISGAFTNLADNIKGIFYTRSVLSPEWVHKYVSSSGILSNSSRSACTSDMFFVSGECKVSHTLPVYVYVIQYTKNGVFVSRTGLLRYTDLTLEKGFAYRLSIDDYALLPNYAEGEPLNNFLNSVITIDSSISVFDSLANMVLYFNSDGIYNNPFTFGNIEGVSEYTAHIQGAFDGFNDGINDFVAPIGVVNAVLDEVVGEWGFVAVAVTFVLSALVLIRFLGV